MPATVQIRAGHPRLLTRVIGWPQPGLLAVIAWALISLGAAVHYGVYTPLAIALVTAGVLVLTVLVFRLPAAGYRPPSRLSLLLAATVTLVSTVASPADRYARGPAATWSHGLQIMAALAVLALATLPGWTRLHRAGWQAMLALAGAAGVAGIRATPHPTIDDWHILQGSAKALLHGHNIYGQAWPGAEGHLLPYLPGSAILLAPFYLVASDVRYGLLAAMLVAAALVGRLDPARRRRQLAVLSGLIVCYPWALYLIEQSWPEPLLLALLAAMVWASHRHRPVLAVLCLTAALITKQHVVILLPLAAIWPAFGLRRTVTATVAAGLIIAGWLIADPHQFWQGAVRYNLSLPPRHDSLSLFTTAYRLGHQPSFALVPLLMLAALGLALWKLPRTTPGFVFGSAWLLGIFNLLNKQSFFNEWSLVIGLLMLGTATLAAAPGRLRGSAGSAG